jgi:hypothetical protein
MAAERPLLERLPINEEGQVGVDSRDDRYNGWCTTHVSTTEKRLSVLVGIGYVAHAVTRGFAVPILLETAARASPIFAHGLGIVQA